MYYDKKLFPLEFFVFRKKFEIDDFKIQYDLTPYTLSNDTNKIYNNCYSRSYYLKAFH